MSSIQAIRLSIITPKAWPLRSAIFSIPARAARGDGMEQEPSPTRAGRFLYDVQARHQRRIPRRIPARHSKDRAPLLMYIKENPAIKKDQEVPLNIEPLFTARQVRVGETISLRFKCLTRRRFTRKQTEGFRGHSAAVVGRGAAPPVGHHDRGWNLRSAVHPAKARRVLRIRAVPVAGVKFNQVPFVVVHAPRQLREYRRAERVTASTGGDDETPEPHQTEHSERPYSPCQLLLSRSHRARPNAAAFSAEIFHRCNPDQSG